MELKGWADLPAELLAMIADRLQGDTNIRRFGGVCHSWRFSSMSIRNKQVLPPLFPRSLSSCSWDLSPDKACYLNIRALHCVSRPQYLIAKAIYHLRFKKANWIVSVQESKSGKLLLRDALTCEPIPGFYGCRLDMSGWSLTRICISHRFSTPTCACLLCYDIGKTKVVFDDGPDPMGLFIYYGISALRRCLSTDAGQIVTVRRGYHDVCDFVNFNGRIYVVGAQSIVYMLDRTRLQLLRLTCVNLLDSRCVWCPRKRFLVSDGELYLLFSFCKEHTPLCQHEILVYKLVIDGINATCYHLEKVENLGDRVFFVGVDCSFSVSARDLPPSLVGNCILVARYAFLFCSCFSGFYVYHLGGVKPAMMTRRLYSTLFKPPRLCVHQMVNSQRDRKRKRKN